MLSGGVAAAVSTVPCALDDSKRRVRTEPSKRGLQGAPLLDHFPRFTFDEWTEPGGGLLVGSPQQVIEKLLEIHSTLGNTRYMAQIGLGGLPFAETARSIELLATEIMPAVNREIGAAG